MHHYPPGYTSDEQKKDERDVSRGIAFLLGRFGAPSAPELATTATTFYQIGSTGGTSRYWASARPSQSRSYVYHVDFPRAGRGFIKIDVVAFAPLEGFQIKGIDFGLPVSPGSKRVLLSAMRDLLAWMSVPIPADFDELAEQALQPTTVPPASPAE